MQLANVLLPETGNMLLASLDGEIFHPLQTVMMEFGLEELAVAMQHRGLEAFIAACGKDAGLQGQVVDALGGLAVPGVDLSSAIWLAPLANPKIICVANNNTAFAKDIIRGPRHPALFNKPASALIGHGRAIELRQDHGITYPEPELAVIVSRQLKNASPDECQAAIFAYTIHNDVTSATMREEDTFHYREATVAPDGTFRIIESHASYPGRYKGSDTFAPMGPWLVTADKISDPHALAIECWMDDQLAYSDNTRNLTHHAPDVLAWASRYQSILPGDVVSLGTASDPAGETGDRPQVSTNMNSGCRSVAVRIERIGTLRNSVSVT